VFKGLIS